MNGNIRALYFVVFAYLSQLIIANIYYGDDLYRSVFGFGLWYHDGRPFADWFYSVILLFHDTTLPDIYPLPLLISGLVFCYIFSHLTRRLNLASLNCFFVIPLVFISNPFFISNLLFRYDGSFMLLAMSMAILPFSLDTKSTFKWIISTSLCLLSAFCLYQASINIYIGLTSIFVLYKIIEKESIKNIVFFILSSISSLVIAYIIYSKIILNAYDINSYFSNFNQTIPLSIDGVGILWKNAKDASGYILVMIKSGLLYPLATSYIIATAIIIKYSIVNRNPLVIASYFLSVFICLFSSVGIILFGISPAYFSRVFIGVSIMLSFPLLVIFKVNHNKHINSISSILVSLPLICISVAAINASKQEVEFNNTIADKIVTSVYNSPAKDNKKLAILGDLKMSPRATINNMAYPIVSLILPPIFKSGYDGGRFTLMNKGIGDITFINQSELAVINSAINNTQPFSDSNLYALYNINDTTVIRFK